MYNNKYLTEVQTGAVIRLTDNLPISVLYVEEERLFSKVTKEVLELQGKFRIHVASSVQDAYKKMKQKTYDAIVSDYCMPEKDGLQFLKELRESGNNIPFILFTGKGREEVAIRALNLGADLYVDKHGDSETVYYELAHAIRQAVDRNLTQIESLKRTAKLNAILESSPEAITITDLNGNIVECNQAAVDMHDEQSEKDLVGKNALELIAKKDHKRAIEGLKETFEHGSTKNVEYTFVAKDGREFPAELSASVVRDASGKPEYFMALSKDITERKKVEEQLKQAEQTAKALLNAPTDVSILIDKEGFVIAANEAAVRGLAKSSCEIIGMNIYSLLLPEVAQKRRIYAQQVINTGNFVRFEDEQDGRNLYNSVYPVLDMNGKVERLAIVAHDITELRKAEEKIRLLSNVVQQASEGIAVSDLSGRILFANSAWLKMHNFNEDEIRDLLGKAVGRFYCEKQVEAIDRKVLSEGTFRGRITQVRKDGTTFPALATLSPLRDEKGQVVGIIRMAKILTEIVRDIRDTRSMNSSCTEKNKAEGRGS